MTLEQLEAVNAVVEHGSFRAAAEKLNRSQPALSATIKQLEEEFDLLIFDRSEYRPKLTIEGAAFLAAAKATLDASKYAVRVAQELGKKKAETRLLVSADALIAPEFIELVAQECARPVHPVSLILQRSIFKEGFEPLIQGKVDLAFAPCPDDVDEIEAIPLETINLVGVVSRKLLQEKRKPTADFLKKNAQVVVYERGFKDDAEKLLPKAIQQRANQKLFVPDHFTKLRLIEAGIGWGRVSKKEYEASDDLVLIDKNLFAHMSFELCLLRSKYRPLGPVARAIWSAFEKQTSRS